MVLRSRDRGRVGRCRHLLKTPPLQSGGVFVVYAANSLISLAPRMPSPRPGTEGHIFARCYCFHVKHRAAAQLLGGVSRRVRGGGHPFDLELVISHAEPRSSRRFFIEGLTQSHFLPWPSTNPAPPREKMCALNCSGPEGAEFPRLSRRLSALRSTRQSQ